MDAKVVATIRCMVYYGRQKTIIMEGKRFSWRPSQFKKPLRRGTKLICVGQSEAVNLVRNYLKDELLNTYRLENYDCAGDECKFVSGDRQVTLTYVYARGSDGKRVYLVEAL